MQLVGKALKKPRIERGKISWFRICMIVVWAGMVVATAIKAGIGWVDPLFPGSGQFATSAGRSLGVPNLYVVIESTSTCPHRNEEIA